MRHSAESHRDHENCQHGDRSAPPAFLTFSGEEWKRQKHDDSDGGTDQQYRCLRGRREEREQRVEPKEEEVGARGSLNNGWVWLAARTEGAKVNRARGDRKENETGEHDVLPDRTWHERYALLMRQLSVFLHVRGAPNDASRHGPLIDSKFQHHEQMDTDERDQQSRDYKDVQREEPRKRCAGNDRAAEHEVH